MENGGGQGPGAGGRQPVFLVPGMVTGLVLLMGAIHLAATTVLDGRGQQAFVTWFAFIPYRLAEPGALPGGLLPLLWTPVTHALMHADWIHFGINAAWLAIFGTPVARRYGAGAMLAIFLVGAVAGAAAYAAVTFWEVTYLVGASGGVAGLTGAAMRFVFQPLQIARHPETGDAIVLGRRTASLAGLTRDRRARAFIVIWIGLNLAVPILPALTGGAEMAVAWQAHIGGFVAGLLAVPAVERALGQRR